MALYDSVTCGKASKKKDLADEDSESKQRREWNDLVLNEGTELVNICFLWCWFLLSIGIFTILN